MRIIARKALREYGLSNDDAKKELDAWFAEASRADWKTPIQVKQSYGSASILRCGRVVFNICGNKHRLVVHIRYDLGIVFIRFIGTHAEYDKIDAETV